MIDLSRLPLPAAVEVLDPEQLIADFITRFLAAWDEARERDPTLPAYDVDRTENDPVVLLAQAWSQLRFLDRGRVNDAFEAELAPRARGTNLDNIVAGQNIERLVAIPATETSAAVMESDAQLLRRYLLSFERPSAGSANRFLLEAWTAWPNMLDARVNGHAIHGRRGDIDIVIAGPAGVPATNEQRQAVRNAVTHPSVQPVAVAVSVLNAERAEYAASLVIEVALGPDPEVVRAEALARVSRAAEARMLIGGEVPAGFLAGAAYGDSIIKVRDLAPVAIAADPYKIPVATSIAVAVEVRQ